MGVGCPWCPLRKPSADFSELDSIVRFSWKDPISVEMPEKPENALIWVLGCKSAKGDDLLACGLDSLENSRVASGFRVPKSNSAVVRDIGGSQSPILSDLERASDAKAPVVLGPNAEHGIR